MSLPKPVMRGLLGKRLRFHLPIAFSLALIAAISFKVTGDKTVTLTKLLWLKCQLAHVILLESHIFKINLLLSSHTSNL